jgi:hypothetical protein
MSDTIPNPDGPWRTPAVAMTVNQLREALADAPGDELVGICHEYFDGLDGSEVEMTFLGLVPGTGLIVVECSLVPGMTADVFRPKAGAQ